MCVFVTKNHHFLFARAERWRLERDIRRALPAVGQFWPGVDDDDASSEEPHNPKDKEGLVQCH